jgi:hypothetical protein
MNWVPRQRPSPAFVLAAISLFVSLSGGAYAISLGRNVVGARNIKPSAVKTAKIADGAVTSSKLGDGAVTTLKLADGAVTTVKLGDSAVNGAKVANGSLTGADIAPETITGLNILDGSIGSSDLGSSSVTSTQLATGAVTPAKVGTIPTVRARRTSAQTINSGSFTPINLTTETWDTASMHSTSSNTSRLRAPIAGTYLITANVSWLSNNTGRRSLEITLDSFTETNKPIAAIAQSADLSDAPMALSTVYQLGLGDFVQAQVQQDSGIAQSVAASSSGDETSPEVSMTWLGPT